MSRAQDAVRRFDAFQRRHKAIAFLFAVNKKAGDDNAGVLVSNLAYVGFLSVFPLLLIAVTVIGILADNYPGIKQALDRSVIADFPIIGSQLVSNVSALHRSSTLGLVVGLLGLLWGVTGLAQSGMFAMAQVWNVPGVDRPNFAKRLARSGAFLSLLAVDVLVTGFLAGFGTLGRHDLPLGIGSEALGALVNIAAYFLSFRILTPRLVRASELIPGAIVGGLAWTALLAVGSYLVGRDLRTGTAVYGLFAYVLGLIAWIYLAARIYVFSAEINVVRAYQLTPRSIVTPPFTPADTASLALQVTSNRRRPEQTITVSWDAVDEAEPAVGATGPAPGAEPAVCAGTAATAEPAGESTPAPTNRNDVDRAG